MKEEKIKAILTIIGEDKIGIISKVSTVLADNNVNILDINQTVMREYFTMIMLVDLEGINITLRELQEKLVLVGKNLGLSIKIHREDILKRMHEI